MSKKILPLLIIFLVFLTTSGSSLAAGKGSGLFDEFLPEQEGVYNVPGRANLKLRVFVHNLPAKPNRNSQLSLTCEIPDPDADQQVSPAGWRLPQNWTYNLNPDSVPGSIGPNNFANIAQNAFTQWTSVLGGKVTITPGPNTLARRASFDGVNMVAWGRAPATALAVTYVWYDTTTATAVEIDTVMNKKFSWAWSDPASWNTSAGTTCAYSNVYDAQNILTHEIGHWLGLTDEYDAAFQNHTMYGYGSVGETKKDTLTTGDTAGMIALYQP